MKRLSTFVFALLLAGTLSFAQGTTGDKKPAGDQKPAADDTGKKGKGGKKGHKGGKKGKKGGGDAGTTPPPK
jgi:hypothetical protein